MLLDHVGMSANRFAVHIGLKSPQVLYDIRRGRNGISKDLAEKISAKCVNVDIGWLVTGDGDMLKEDPTSVQCDQQQTYGEHPLQEQVRKLQAEICRLQNKIIDLQDERTKECARLMTIIIELQQQSLKSKGEVGGGKNGPVQSGFAETA